MSPNNYFKSFNHNTLQYGPTIFFPNSWECVLGKLGEDELKNDNYGIGIPINQRISLFQKIKSTLLKSKQELSVLYCQESGLSKARFLLEFERIVLQLDHFSSFLERGKLADTKECKLINGTEVSFIRVIQPVGRVLVIGASNFPLAYSAIGGDVISALAAGCSVCYKAHPFHIGTSLLVAELIEKCLIDLSLPAHIYVHYVDNHEHKVTNNLLHSGKINAVGFTGSQDVGRLLMNTCAALPIPIPVFAEMGSVNPVVLLSEGLATNSASYAELLAKSISNDAGQFCTKPGIIFYPNSTSGEGFKGDLISSFAKQPRYHMLHPMIQKRYQLATNQLLMCKEANLLYQELGENSIQGDKIVVELPASTMILNPEICAEIFGPCVILVAYESREELLRLLSKLDGQLTGTILGERSDIVLQEVLSIFSKICGRVIFDGVPTGVNVLATMQHGGPYPSSSDVRFTAVGEKSVWRFARAVTFQNF